MKPILALALPFVLLAHGAQAVEVTGGSLSLGYSAFTGSDGNDLNKTSLGGSLELGFSPQFSLQGDLNQTTFGLSDVDSGSLGLHAIFHLSDSTSLGAFVGADRIDGDNLNFYGIEVGQSVGQFGAEAYLGHADADDVSGTVLGVKGDYFLSDTFTLGARYDNIDVEGVDLSRLALTGQVNLTPGLALTGEIGSAEVEDSGSETFVGVGVKLHFGAKRGATFDQRSVIDLIPGL